MARASRIDEKRVVFVGVRLDLTPEEAAVLNRLLYAHISGASTQRDLLTEGIGAALREADAPMSPPLSVRPLSETGNLRIDGIE